jgi:hypothetical protein
MTEKTRSTKAPRDSDVTLAIASLDGTPSPLEDDLRGLDPAPTSLDLPLPDSPDNRHAPETGAVRCRTNGRSLQRRNRPPLSS